MEKVCDTVISVIPRLETKSWPFSTCDVITRVKTRAKTVSDLTVKGKWHWKPKEKALIREFQYSSVKLNVIKPKKIGLVPELNVSKPEN